MKIKKINMLSYGKFENREIPFSNGLNIVKGRNEAGKSTVMSFIKAMLYGFSGRGAVAANDRKHYLPWGKSTLSGSADILLDSGKCVKLSRTSGKSQGFDKIDCFDISNSESYNFIPENECGCAEDAFLKTLCIKQLQSAISGEDDEISKKLINLTSSGAEDISAQKSEALITDYIKKFKALRGEKGLIFDLQNQIADINARLATAEQQRVMAFEQVKEKNMLTDKIRQCREKLAFIKKSGDAAKNQELFLHLDMLTNKKSTSEKEIAALKAEKEKIADVLSSLSVYESDPPEAIFTPITETETLKSECEKCKQKIKTSKILISVFLPLTLLFAAASVLFLPIIIAEAVTVPLLIMYIVNYKKAKGTLADVSAELDEITTLNKEIGDALKLYDVKDIKEYAEKKARYTTLLSELENIKSSISAAEQKLFEICEEINICTEKTSGIEREATQYTSEELAEEERALNIILEDAISRNSHIDGFLSAAAKEEETTDILIARRAALIEELDRATANLEAATLALDAVNSVFSQMRSDFTPLVNEKASKYLEEITGGSLDKIYIDKKFSVTAEKEGVYDISYFSLGTSDQTYLAIRLAIIDLLFGKDKPIFIDDAFLQYDSEREKKAFDLLLKRAAEGQQIIFFTCRPVPDLKGDFNVIDLDNLG